MPGVVLKSFFLDNQTWEVPGVINSKRIDVALGVVSIGVLISPSIGVVTSTPAIDVSATLPDGIVVDVEDC